MSAPLPEEINAKLNALAEKVESLGAKVDPLSAKVEALDSKVAPLTGKLDALDGKMQPLSTKADVLGVKVDALPSKLDDISQKVQAVNTALDKKPDRKEQLLAGAGALVLAVLTTLVTASITSHFTKADTGPNAAMTELAKKRVETYSRARSFALDVKLGFEEYIVREGRDERKANSTADKELNKIVESGEAGTATPAPQEFNDDLHEKKAALSEARTKGQAWDKAALITMQSEVQKKFDAANAALDKWIDSVSK